MKINLLVLVVRGEDLSHMTCQKLDIFRLDKVKKDLQLVLDFNTSDL